MAWQGIYGIVKDEPEDTPLESWYWAGEKWTQDINDAVCFDSMLNAIDYATFLDIMQETLPVEGNENQWFNINNLMTRKVFKPQ